jgi:hypothetical protein
MGTVLVTTYIIGVALISSLLIFFEPSSKKKKL